MNGMIILLVLGFAAVLLVPVAIPYLQNILFMASTVERVTPDEEEEVFRSSHSRINEDMIVEMGFEREGAYLVDLKMCKAVFAMWRHKHSATYLAVYAIGSGLLTDKSDVDFVSVLSRDPNLGLTTGTTKDGHTNAKLPGDYMQTFSGLSINAMFDQHVTGEAYIASKHQIDPQPVMMSGAECLLSALRDNSRKKLLRPWLTLQVPYRFWIGRHINHNKTVEQIHGPL